REDAQAFVRAARSLYASIAFDATDPAEKARFEAERDKQSALLKSRRWMDAEEAGRIVREYSGLIERLRAVDKRGSA
ncbi:hypothetical protein ACW9HQ_45200, partial [Nocardia gipuzkoensis]